MKTNLKKYTEISIYLVQTVLSIGIIIYFCDKFFNSLHIVPKINTQEPQSKQFIILNLYLVGLTILSWYYYYKNFEVGRLFQTILIPCFFLYCINSLQSWNIVKSIFGHYNLTNSQILTLGIILYTLLFIAGVPRSTQQDQKLPVL